MCTAKRLAIALPYLVVASCFSVPRAHAHDYSSTLPAIRVPLAASNGSAFDMLAEPVSQFDAACALRLRFVHAGSRKPAAVLVRIIDRDGRRVRLPGLLSRAAALSPKSVGASSFVHADSWSIVPGELVVAVPQEVLTIEAIRGPNSTWFSKTLDLRGNAEESMEETIKPLIDGAYPWQGGNPHLHLQKMTLDEAERYVCETAAADGYDIVFLSYLERAEADLEYISNTFTADDLARFTKRCGVLFAYGEEYRHNFVKNSEGYGHVMLLDLKELILPASLGYAITRSSNDDQPLRDGIIRARKQDATVLWCHGTQGYEDVPNWFAGLVDVQMIFDQGSKGTYESAIYRYLNAGLRVPLATGTDWFFRDMAMAYVQVDEPLTKGRWLEALRAGRSFITNGPLVSFTVNGQPIGSAINAAPGDTLDVAASIVCRGDFNDLELIRNGNVIGRANAVQRDGRFIAEFRQTLPVGDASWYAVRATPFTANYDKPETSGVGYNEYGKPYFAHSSPIYVTVNGYGTLLPDAVASLLDEVRESRAFIAEEGDFSSDADRDRLLRIYDEAAESLQHRVAPSE
ncbi:MAG: CehA/McbA family metallohydrolase [Candidatus Hydrogenedentes bacterium]|nr:CehA/McbA family metallohydrolase [Candidatus Hydrogenedentota bacterium]